jgi:hypothetical protein
VVGRWARGSPFGRFRGLASEAAVVRAHRREGAMRQQEPSTGQAVIEFPEPGGSS